MSLPILYSFRRCPYAMRARMALLQANIRCELREVVLKEKPEAMIALSDKGTVPVLLTPEQNVLEESLDVMHWALSQSDPDNWLGVNNEITDALIKHNDGEFKHYLDRYKYHVGYPEHPPEYYRDKAAAFLERLEQTLQQHDGKALASATQLTFTDIAIFPFVRQFAHVDLNWFEESPYTRLKQWYNSIAQSDLFQRCMHKYAQWQPDQSPVYFPA